MADARPTSVGKRSRIKKKKTKTFSGCWTCRERHVKCDEKKPACGRCTRGRLDCQGYEVRLLWVENAQNQTRVATGTADGTPHTRTGTDSRPRPTPQATRPLTPSSSQSVPSPPEAGPGTNSVVNVTSPSSLEPPTTPFAADSVDNFLDQCQTAFGNAEQVISPGASSTAHQDAIAAATLSQLSQPPQNVVQNYTTNSGTSLSPIARRRSPSSSLLNARSYLPAGDETISSSEAVQVHSLHGRAGLSPERWRHMDSTMDLSQYRVVPYLDGPILQSRVDELSSPREILTFPIEADIDENEASESLAELMTPSCQKILIHHWVFFMCKNMVPVDLIDNPYRTMILPFAFEAVDAPVHQAKSNLAIFHGLCAVSAENQIYLGVAKPGVTRFLAARHNRLALQHLQAATRNEPPPDMIASTLSAILICIMRDTVCGEANTWRDHVQGALSCLPKPSQIEVTPGSVMHTSLEQFLCLAVLGNVPTTYDLDALIGRLPEAVSYIGQYHGIDRFLLFSVLSVNRYAHHANSHDSPLATAASPASVQSGQLQISLEDMERLELKAYLRAPTAIPPNIYRQPPDAIIAMHYNHVYYHALLLYIKRTVHGTPAEELADMINSGLLHLEKAEEVSGGTNGCIFLWPCLVIAEECCTWDLKARALAWFEKKRRHGFKAVDKGADILVRYWAWRDRDPERARYVSWQGFVRGTSDDVVPI